MPPSYRAQHKAYWALKNCNMDLTKAGANRFLKIKELEELRLDAYESSITYKERRKRWHDKRIKTPTELEKGDKVLLYNSRLRLFPDKLKSRWYGPFAVNRTMKNRAIRLCDDDGRKAHLLKDKQIPSVGVFDENHLEKIHAFWTQFGKKRDKIATLLEVTRRRSRFGPWRRRHIFFVTTPEFSKDNVKIHPEDVKVTDSMLTTSRLTSDDVTINKRRRHDSFPIYTNPSFCGLKEKNLEE
ncbi:hypothetical protein Tco_0241626 [Tanacetum coccineum]